MNGWDRLRQVATFLLGVGFLVFDLVTPTPHDWVVILMALVLMGLVPVEYLYRATHPPVEPPVSPPSSDRGDATGSS